jgi:hypothetical protein
MDLPQGRTCPSHDLFIVCIGAELGKEMLPYTPIAPPRVKRLCTCLPPTLALWQIVPMGPLCVAPTVRH